MKRNPLMVDGVAMCMSQCPMRQDVCLGDEWQCLESREVVRDGVECGPAFGELLQSNADRDRRREELEKRGRK